MTHATIAAFAFDVKKAAPTIQPQRLIGGSLMIEHAEWLQMTIGPFIAPARRSITGEVEYLVDGLECPNGEATGATIARELDALEMALARVRESLKRLMQETKRDNDVSPATTLLSLRMLLDVNFPDPEDGKSVHLCGDRLQLSHWGLSTGIPLRQMLAELNAKPGAGYIGSLRQTLSTKYGAPHPDATGLPVSPAGERDWITKLAVPSFLWTPPKRALREHSYAFTRDGEMPQRLRLFTGRNAMYAACLLIWFMSGLLLGVLMERTDFVRHAWRSITSIFHQDVDPAEGSGPRGIK